MSKLIKPKKLEKGDTIAFIAPASGMAKFVPHRLEKGKQFFEELGYKVKIFPTATNNIGLSSDTPENPANNNKNNLIVLCASCHRKVGSKTKIQL